MMQLKKIITLYSGKLLLLPTFLTGFVSSAYAQNEIGPIDPGAIGFEIPTFTDILTVLIRLFFILAGLAALFMLLTGALSWVTSGGNKENVEKARDKITQALVGLILIIVVLAVIVALEQVVFQQALCFGVSCAIKFPKPLLTPA